MASLEKSVRTLKCRQLDSVKTDAFITRPVKTDAFITQRNLATVFRSALAFTENTIPEACRVWPSWICKN